MRSRSLTILCLAALGVLVFVIGPIVSVRDSVKVRAADVTSNKLGLIERQLQAMYFLDGKLPTTLMGLENPPLVRDGWDRELEYQVLDDANLIIRLRSRGASLTSTNDDIIRTFRLRKTE